MWGDLLAIVQSAPRSSALYRSLHPDDAEWGLPEQLLALNADYAAILAWQNSGGSKKDYPKPIDRPGITSDEEKHGNQPLPMDEMETWLGW